MILEGPSRFGELHDRRLELTQKTLNKQIMLLKVHQEVVPQWLLSEDLRVTQDDDSITTTREGHVETSRVVQETNALSLV